MIAAVCLNPSIDRTVSIPAFEYGGMNRVTSSREDAGGKGVNVALAAARLGLDASLVGFLWRENGGLIEEKLAQAGVARDFVHLDGRVRTNMKLLDESRGAVTELNEPGARVDAPALARMTEMILARAKRSDFLVLTGSLPPGVPSGYYQMLTEAVAGTNCRVALDAEGEKLALGVRARPFLIKPNRFELTTLVGGRLDTVAQVRDAALSLVGRGVSVVAVSLGGEGALIADAGGAYFAPALPVPVRSTVGAGDTMLAALLGGLERRLPLREAFRLAVAAATACVMSEGTQPVDAALVNSLLPRVRADLLAGN